MWSMTHLEGIKKKTRDNLITLYPFSKLTEISFFDLRLGVNGLVSLLATSSFPDFEFSLKIISLSSQSPRLFPVARENISKFAENPLEMGFEPADNWSANCVLCVGELDCHVWVYQLMGQ